MSHSESSPNIIIVGAGSAGCLLAHQLAHPSSGDGGQRVLLIEPELSPAPAQNRTRPSHWINLLGSSDDWDFSTEPIKQLAGRSLRWPRGRGLGGSGRINAMIWFPPTHQDLANLAELTDTDLATIQAAFETAESIVRPETARWQSDAAKQFSAAVDHVDRGRSNRGNVNSQAIYQRVNRGGRRWSPDSLLQQGNVRVHRGTVDRVLFDGQRAVGVRLADGEEIRCRERVVLSAGAIATPMILMRSGIGPSAVLSDCGIECRVDQPAVGENLQDHLIMPVIFGVNPDHAFASTPSDEDVRQWEADGSGSIACNIAEAGGLFDDGQVQIHVTPTHYLLFPSPKAPPALTIGVNVTQPESKGRLTITSADPHAPPRIEPNYLSEPCDLQKTIDAVRLARQIAADGRFDQMLTGELLPGVRRESDEAIAKSIQRYSQTLYHPVGTASGIETGARNLHIVDASAFKKITVGNPNAAVMTLAVAIAKQFQR